ncbi:RELT-like protein 2 isoform X2 [Xenopus laevis]|uniref:RELT-like protein 2 isoform X2 n=1 Tax=Xenopus laevis TaxID=8355 RepID=A0A8J0UMG5_XENLA|nr:RELT-like protein 2 isoform X2 [Xenopus laevis]
MGMEINMEEEEVPPQQSPYMLFLLVLVFFVTGLLGFLICHVLKKKGYRCRTFPEELDPEAKEELNVDLENAEEMSNEDTVERIVKCIIQNEANAEALKQMLGDTEGDVPIVPRFRVTHIGKKHSIQGSQDGTNESQEPVSSDKNHEEQPMMRKSSTGLAQQQDQNVLGMQDLSQNGPDMVGLAKLEAHSESEAKSVGNSSLRRLEEQFQRYSLKKQGSKERRSSAPEKTAAEWGKVGIIERVDEKQKETSSENADEQKILMAKDCAPQGQ